MKSLEYRHVNKKTYHNKKYYYKVVSTYNASKEASETLQKYWKGQVVEITMKSGSKYYGDVNLHLMTV